MVAYFISFLLLGLPICWAEWTMGRRGGELGFNSSPGILAAVTQKKWSKWLGIIGVMIPVVIYMYYVYIEAWCLGYAVNFASGNMHFESAEDSTDFWARFIGAGEDGSAIGFGMQQVGGYLIAVFILNFYLIYRGLSKGIELFCKYALPTLLLLAIIILIRVLTLGTPDAAHPERNVSNGLGFMWNPEKFILQEQGVEGTWTDVREFVDRDSIQSARAEIAANPQRRLVKLSIFDQLMNPDLWLAAAGQIFFSLSVGFGVIITYSSYLKKEDDVVLSGLAATSANEFCEVVLGGLITLPAAVVFLGLSGLAGVGLGTFDLGFKVLPMVFSSMPAGGFFGFLFFFLLFLAAVTSSLSMLQPGIAFVEEALEIGRKQSVAILGFITAVGCGLVVYFSKDAKALDTLDFWVGTFLIYIMATIIIVFFGWVVGLDKGMEMAHEGSAIRIPKFFRFVMKYVSPVFLLVVFVNWFLQNIVGVGREEASGYVLDLIGSAEQPASEVAILSVSLVVLLGLFFVVMVANS